MEQNQEPRATSNQLSPEMEPGDQVQDVTALDDGVTPFANPIYHIADVACVRVFKELIALKAAGYSTQPMAVVYGAGELMDQIGPVWFHRRDDSLARILQALPFEAVFHIHAEPAGIAHFVRKVRPFSPVVLDVHDADWGRGKGATQLELLDLEACDAVVVPSEHYRLFVAERAASRREAVIVRSTCVGTPPEKPDYPRLGGIMYQGGMDLNGWRDYREMFALLTKAGCSVYAYAPDAANLTAEYARTGVVLQVREYLQMLTAMTRHDWSLVCPPRDGCGAWRSAMPNKFYESLWCGVPILTYGSDDVADQVNEFNLGYVFKNRDELVSWATKHLHASPTEELRDRCRQYMKLRSMETQVPALRQAYIAAISHRARVVSGQVDPQQFNLGKGDSAKILTVDFSAGVGGAAT
jgi:glycosyltransferase involved in cell wall biosynthesis